MTISSGPSDPVQVSFGIIGKVEVNDHIHSLYIDSTCAQICRYKTPAVSIAESVEYFVPIFLEHLRMDVIAGES